MPLPYPSFYVLSAGNELAKHFGPLLTPPTTPPQYASLMLESIDAQHYSAILVNSSELRLGPDALTKTKTKTEPAAARLSANIAYQNKPQSPIFTPHLILNPDAPGRRVGLTEVSRRDGLDNKLIDSLKVEIQHLKRRPKPPCVRCATRRRTSSC